MLLLPRSNLKVEEQTKWREEQAEDKLKPSYFSFI
jgi:hypothetical protein